MTEAVTVQSEPSAPAGGRREVNREIVWGAASEYCLKNKIAKADLSEDDFKKIALALPFHNQPSARTIRRAIKKMPDGYRTPEETYDRFLDYPIVKEWWEQRQLDAKAGRLRDDDRAEKQLDLLEKLWKQLGRKSPSTWDNKKQLTAAILNFAPSARLVLAASVNQLLARKIFEPYRDFPHDNPEYEMEWKNAVLVLVNNRNRLADFLNAPDPDERCFLVGHNISGAREGYDEGTGGILRFDWKNVNWETNTVAWLETKTGYVNTVPLDLYSAVEPWRSGLVKTFRELLYEKWERDGKPREGRIFHFTDNQVYRIYANASARAGVKIKPHWADKLHVSLAWAEDIRVEIIASGQLGRKWGDTDTLVKFYLSMAGGKIEEAKRILCDPTSKVTIEDKLKTLLSNFPGLNLPPDFVTALIAILTTR